MTRISDDLRLVRNYVAACSGTADVATKLDELSARVRALEDRAGLLTAALHAAKNYAFAHEALVAQIDRVLVAGPSPTVDELESFRHI